MNTCYTVLEANYHPIVQDEKKYKQLDSIVVDVNFLHHICMETRQFVHQDYIYKFPGLVCSMTLATLYQTILFKLSLGKVVLESSWEKEKMLFVKYLPIYVLHSSRSVY